MFTQNKGGAVTCRPNKDSEQDADRKATFVNNILREHFIRMFPCGILQEQFCIMTCQMME